MICTPKPSANQRSAFKANSNFSALRLATAQCGSRVAFRRRRLTNWHAASGERALNALRSLCHGRVSRMRAVCSWWNFGCLLLPFILVLWFILVCLKLSAHHNHHLICFKRFVVKLDYLQHCLIPFGSYFGFGARGLSQQMKISTRKLQVARPHLSETHLKLATSLHQDLYS